MEPLEVLRRHAVSSDAIAHAITICDCLNELAFIDSQALTRLMGVSVPCSERLANHPRTVANQLHTESSTPHFTISLLGVINVLVDENLAICWDGEWGKFRIAVRDSHPDNVVFIDDENLDISTSCCNGCGVPE